MRILRASPFFVGQRLGRWRWPWLFVSLIAAIVGALIAAAALYLVLFLAAGWFESVQPSWGTELTRVLDESLSETATTYTHPIAVAAELLLVGVLFWGAAIAATLVHRRSVRSLLRPEHPFRWNIVAKVLALELSLVIVLVLVSMVIPANAETTFTGFRAEHAFWLLPMALVLLVQTSGEDVFFKGFLLRQLGAATAIFWLAPVVVTGIFVALHFGNSDVQENAALFLTLFVFADLLIAYLILRTRGMEVALVLHWTNNAVIFLLIAEEGTQANDLTLFVTGQVEGDAAFADDVRTGVMYLCYLALQLFAFVWPRSPFYLPKAGKGPAAAEAEPDPTPTPMPPPPAPIPAPYREI